jgi:DNA-binding protein H-NS
MARSPAGIEHLDLENLSDGQLRELIQHARDTLSERVTRRLDEFRLMAREAGFEVSITKVGEGDGRRGRRRQSHDGAGDVEDQRSAVAPKYRNPGSPSETWSGRGRKPKWVEEQLAAGKSLDALLIRSGQQEHRHEEAAEA